MPNNSFQRTPCGGAPSSPAWVAAELNRQAAVSIAIAALVVIAIVSMVGWTVRDESRAKANRVEEAFAGRERLDETAFFERYFKSKGVSPVVVSGVRTVLERQLDADMSRLSAEDDFSKNLSFLWHFDSMENVELLCALEDHFGIAIPDEEAEKTRTIEQLVALISNKLQNKHAA